MNAHKICHCDAQIHTHTHTHTHTSTYCSLEKLPIMSSLFFISSFVFFLDWQIEIRDRAIVLFFFLSSYSIPYYSFLLVASSLSPFTPSFLPPSSFLTFFHTSLLFLLPSLLSHLFCPFLHLYFFPTSPLTYFLFYQS